MARKDDLPEVYGRRDLTDPTPLLVKQKPFAFLQRRETRKVQAVNETVKAGTELANSVAEYKRAVARLRNIDQEIEYDRTALDVHLETVEGQKEDIQWEREQKRHEREQIRASWKKGAQPSGPVEPEVIEPDGIDYGNEVK